MSLANPTSKITLERQIDGTNADTWNDRYSANWARIDAAVGGTLSVDVSGGSVTLTTVDSTDTNADCQQRFASIVATGTPSAPAAVLLSAAIPGKQYLFTNAVSTPQNVVFKVGALTGITVAPGDSVQAVCGATDIQEAATAFGAIRTNGNATYIFGPRGVNPISSQVYGVAFLGQQNVFWSDGSSNIPVIIGVASGSGKINIEFANGGAFPGNITTTSTTTSYNTTSDYRLKVTYGETDAGALIDAIPVHDAAFKSAPDARRPMFLAHEVQAAAPWAVTGEKDAVDDDGNVKPQMVGHSDLVATLWAEVRSLRRRVAQLETR